jgi:hypothetical protein
LQDSSQITYASGIVCHFPFSPGKSYNARR